MKYEFDLIEENVSWEEIPSELDKFDMFCKSLDNIPEHEQTEFLAEIILKQEANFGRIILENHGRKWSCGGKKCLVFILQP